MSSRAGKEGKVQPATSVGQRYYSLRQARPLSNRALEILADGQEYTCRSRSRHPKATEDKCEAAGLRAGNTKPENLQDNENEGAVEVHTGNTQPGVNEREGAVEVGTENIQSEDSSVSDSEENETDDALKNHSDGDETASLTSELEDPEDARNFIPTIEVEVQALTDAIYPTMRQYVGITGRTVDISDARENYFSQWAYYQQHLDAFWARCGRMSVPPILISRDRWIGGIENWRSASELNSGKLTSDSDE